MTETYTHGGVHPKTWGADHDDFKLPECSHITDADYKEDADQGFDDYADLEGIIHEEGDH